MSLLAKKVDWIDPVIFECSRKTAYPLLVMADRAAASITKANGALATSYKCKYCEKWHIGNAHSNIEEEEEKVAMKFFFDFEGLTLAKIKDEMNQYIFAIPPGTPENDQAVLERGILVAVKKGREDYVGKGGIRSPYYHAFVNIFPFYAGDLVRFREKTEKHEEYMEDIAKVRMDFFNGVISPSLSVRIMNARADQKRAYEAENKLREEQKKIANQEMYHGRAVFRNEAGLKPHHRDQFTCCIDDCTEKIELRAYISADVMGKLTSVGSRVCVDSAAIRKGGGNRLHPEFICGKCVNKMSNATAPSAEFVKETFKELKDDGKEAQFQVEFIDDEILDDLERITMNVDKNPMFNSEFIHGALKMAFFIMQRGRI